MATGAAKTLGADYAIAVTGFAGASAMGGVANPSWVSRVTLARLPLLAPRNRFFWEGTSRK